MIKLFRNIRQRLLSENGLAKYISYAVGEIALVVIGILIALQVNNWNEDRRLRQTEKELLLDIRKSLQSDLDTDIKFNLNEIVSDLANISIISHTIDKDLPYHDSLSTKFRSLMFSKSFNWKVSAYMALENEGVQIISNPELKESIITIYNSIYPSTRDRINNFLNNLENFYRPDMRTHFTFRYNKNEQCYFPLNFENLKKNHLFRNDLSTAYLNFSNLQISFLELRDEIERAIILIDKNIEKI